MKGFIINYLNKLLNIKLIYIKLIYIIFRINLRIDEDEKNINLILRIIASHGLYYIFFISFIKLFFKNLLYKFLYFKKELNIKLLHLNY